MSPPSRSALDSLVDLVATAEANGDLVLSASRMVDALLDARSVVDEGPATEAVDDALRACTHRQIVAVPEAVELVAAVSAASAN